MFSTTGKKVLTRLFLWLLFEISLTCLGLDDLADYGGQLWIDDGDRKLVGHL